ncbi:MAG: hypothetical protein JXQ73_16970 [Phycisphaerae bacterium]|nr:hypothetical protein [Phycisphaerae bacterium]
MRKQFTAIMLILCLMSGTVVVGCGQTMQIRAFNTVYNFVTGLAYEWALNQLVPQQTVVATPTT